MQLIVLGSDEQRARGGLVRAHASLWQLVTVISEVIFSK